MRGLLGIAFLIAISYLLSANRRKINWRLVLSGIGIQILIAVLVLNVPLFRHIIDGISSGFLKLLSFTNEGVKFLFGSFASGIVETPLVNFAITILPTVIFFSAFTSLLFYFGILQKLVYALAWLMKKTMRLSGAESLAAAGNIFLGQTEAPLLIKPYIENMTRSEVMCLMSGGMATIAGGVLAAYVSFLGGDDPAQQLFYAKHLITASVMSAPAAIVAAKMMLPETDSFSDEMKISREKIGSNFLEAISNGTGDGLRLAVNVGAMLLVFIALVTLVNYLFEGVVGHYTGLNDLIASATSHRYSGLNMQCLLGYIGAPIAWLLGVPDSDMLLVGQLLGEKTVLNEFYAYTQMGELKNAGMFVYEKSLVMTTYILCGFSNFASIGIQIGGIGALAPSKKGMLSELGLRAMIAGTIACLFTAAVAGMFY
ncbi:MAG: Na+ dependent nucleoside transporter [Flavobacteriales bacterium]|nr:Na+ dependent nucleoside transporter [Flavobacteriales bacterium]